MSLSMICMFVCEPVCVCVCVCRRAFCFGAQQRDPACCHSYHHVLRSYHMKYAYCICWNVTLRPFFFAPRVSVCVCVCVCACACLPSSNAHVVVLFGRSEQSSLAV
uniref:Secreted protein n=1 Tax=Anopheles darlingi TaxID=43151 RepID=A0A2M4CX46_ANODA